MSTLIGDLRFALRLLTRSPGFSVIAIATLSLGIGANTAIFSIVDHVLLRPLPYRDSDRLYAVHEVVPKFAHVAPLVPVNAMHFREWRRNVRSFDRMALIGGVALNMTGTGEPERLAGARVSPALFTMLGVRPQLGRSFAEAEDHPGRDAVVVIDDELWRVRFGADPRVLGRKLVLDGRPYEVIGVLPRDFRFPKLASLYAMTIAEARPQIWKPFAVKDDELESMGDFNYACIVSLKPGVSPAHAAAELGAAQKIISDTVGEHIELLASLVPLQDQITGRSRTGLHLLLGAVGVVLLIGCVNIANLLLAQTTGRRREMAIRSALGASGARLVRQMLVESLVLSAIGGAGGVVVSYTAVEAVRLWAPVDLPRLDEVGVDARVLLFGTVLSVAAGLLCGLLPALRFARADPQDAMKAGARGTTASPSHARVRTLLVAGEIALSTVCLSAAGLLLHSYVKLLAVDAGFDAQHVVTVEINLPPSRYPDLPQRSVLLRSALDAVRVVRGVMSVAVSNQLPLGGEGGNNLVAPEGFTGSFTDRPLADIRQVNPEYFRTLGIPLRSGRVFAEADRAYRVALVSALAAERLWPGHDPVGKRMQMGGDDTPLLQVVGVVGDVRGISLDKAPTMTVYVPYWQRFQSQALLAVRTTLDPGVVGPDLRSALRRVDPELPVPQFRTMDDIVSVSVAERRFQTRLVMLFGLVAALLASLGIYGVMSHSVAQRTGELGIRMALGAGPAGLRWLVLRQCLVPVAAGLACGLVASGMTGQLLSSLLFGVRAVDPLTMTAVALGSFAIAALAAYIPARRATRVDPVVALRQE
jgi:predicted permease